MPGGLDPKERRTTREVDRAKKQQQIPPLDPPFPFRPTPFDPFFFGIEEEPLPVGSQQRRRVD